MPVRVQCRMPFLVASLWRDADTELIYRVVYSSSEHTDLCPISGRHLRFTRYLTSDLRVFTDDGYRGAGRMLRVLEDPYAAEQRTCRPLRGHSQQSADAWRRIKHLVEPEGKDRGRAVLRLLDRGARGRLIREAAELAHVQTKTIHGHLLRYFQRGMNEAAVSSDLPNCGRSRHGGSYRREEDGKRVARNYVSRPGRKPRSQRRHPERQYMLPSAPLTCLLWRGVDLLLTENEAPWLEAHGIRRGRARKSEKEKADAVAQKVARELTHAKRAGRARQTKRGRRSLPSYQNVCDVLNGLTRTKREVRDEQGHLTELELHDAGIITRRQFAYFCQSEPDVRALLAVRRHGHAHPVLLHGYGDQLVKGPGDQFILDATIADIYLVSRLDRTVVVGRPTIYFLIDVFSCLIVGIRVSFERPSYEAAAAVIESAVTPKCGFCARYGFTILPDDWPCHVLSVWIVADRGTEFTATEPWQRLAKLGICISNCRPYTPTWRAILERRWGIVPLIWQRQAVGVVECDWYERGRKRHYPWDAIYTLSEFMTEVLRAIHIYHRTPISRDTPYPEMVFSHTGNTPLKLWRWGIENMSGTLYEHPIRDIQLATWYRHSCTLTARGISYHEKYYTSKEIESAYLERLGRKDRQMVVRSDPDDLGGMWVELDGYPVYALAEPLKIPVDGVSRVEWQQYCDQKNENDREETFAQQPERIRQLNNARVDTGIAQKRTREALKAAGKSHPTAEHLGESRREENALNRMAEKHAPLQGGPSRAGVSSAPQTKPERAGRLRDEREAAALKLLRTVQEPRRPADAGGIRK